MPSFLYQVPARKKKPSSSNVINLRDLNSNRVAQLPAIARNLGSSYSSRLPWRS